MNGENTTLEEDTEHPQLKPMMLTLKYTRTKFAKRIDAVLENLDEPDLIGTLFMFNRTPEGHDFWNDQMENGLNEKGKTILLGLRNKERQEVILDLSYQENGEHFATSQRHPTRQLGIAAAGCALARHQFEYVDETKAEALEVMKPPPPAPSPEEDIHLDEEE